MKLWHIVRHCKFSDNPKKHHSQPEANNRGTKVQGYKLMSNDIIKLGRVRFKIREIVSPAYSNQLLRAKNRLK